MCIRDSCSSSSGANSCRSAAALLPSRSLCFQWSRGWPQAAPRIRVQPNKRQRSGEHVSICTTRDSKPNWTWPFCRAGPPHWVLWQPNRPVPP
eukprot:5345679-Pyramimonas_sp.AAC.1